MHVHVVATNTGGFAAEDGEVASVLGAFTDNRLANQVKTLWGPTAVVRTALVDVVPKGVQNMAAEMGIELRPTLDKAPLERARMAHEKATPGTWSWNCAGEILATVEGEQVVIGTFNGCEADAAAVCKMHNRALELFQLAGVTL